MMLNIAAMSVLIGFVLFISQEVQGLWEGYKETYAKLEPMRQGLAMYMQEKSAGHKRKLADIQSEGERLMSDVER